MALKIFISYSTKDLEIVNRIQTELIHTEYEIFIAEYSTLPGEELSLSIQNAIRNCDVFIVLWSKNSEYSKWVPQEIGYAKGLSKLIIPLVLNDNTQLPGFISDLKYLDLTKGFQNNLEDLRLILSDKSSKKYRDQLIGWGIISFVAYMAFVKEG